MNSDSLDLVAAARVSRNVEVDAIYLTEVQLASEASGVVGGELRLENCPEHRVTKPTVQDGKIDLNCAYRFAFVDANDLALTLSITYNAIYDLRGEPPEEYDLFHFADANGRYHTWPFARETVVSLTAKRGYVPFVLPALSFSPKVSDDTAPNATAPDAPNATAPDAPDAAAPDAPDAAAPDAPDAAAPDDENPAD